MEQAEIALPPLEGRSTPRSSAQNLARLLRDNAPFTLFFDCFDRAADCEPVVAWLSSLVKELPRGSQVVLCGRRLPADLLSDPAVRAVSALHPVAPERMLLDYVSQPQDRILLEVYGHGPGRALINGRPIEEWDGMLPRALFFYFIDRGMVTRDEIFRTFWPSLPVREATNVFHVTKRKISEILGFDLTIYWSGFYRIAPTIDLHYDVVKFAEQVQNSAVADQDTAAQYLEHAIHLYRGIFLSALDGAWLRPRREDLESIYVDALSGLARIHEQDGAHPEALGLYLRASSLHSHREDLARAVMSLYHRMGDSDRALRTYDRLVRDLRTALNVSPDPRTTELANEIRAQG
jgi:DNA-binding SARP family transcriptional activator